MGRPLKYIHRREQLHHIKSINMAIDQKSKHVLLEPPTSPIASCNFLFWPPDRVLALDLTLRPRSQSRSSCSTSSSAWELSDHFTALQTCRVWRQVSSGNKTFFCGTIPSVPLGGLATPPSKVTEPLVRPAKPPMMDNEVDFPALMDNQHWLSCLKSYQPTH